MPIARNIFYDIKIKMKNLIIKFEDKNNDINKKENLKEQIKKLIDSYQIEKQTNSDIFDFFSKKYNEIIIFNEEELKKEEENKNKMEEEGLGLKEEKEENKDESIKSNKHKGRNKKIKHKNDEENSNKEKEKMDIKQIYLDIFLIFKKLYLLLYAYILN